MRALEAIYNCDLVTLAVKTIIAYRMHSQGTQDEIYEAMGLEIILRLLNNSDQHLYVQLGCIA